jgi:hypothetical protein
MLNKINIFNTQIMDNKFSNIKEELYILLNSQSYKGRFFLKNRDDLGNIREKNKKTL